MFKITKLSIEMVMCNCTTCYQIYVFVFSLQLLSRVEPLLVAATAVEAADHQPLPTAVAPYPPGEDDNAPSLMIEEER